MALHQQDVFEPSTIPAIVLFVDDDRDTLDMYATYFESSGWWVSTASVPGEALSTIDELRPDVVVTDISFGGTGQGADLVRAVKLSESRRDIPLIVLSALDVELLPSGTQEAADLCLVKPVRPDVLLVQVQRLAARAHELSARDDVDTREDELEELSAASHDRTRRGNEQAASEFRRCPRCSGSLDWIDRQLVSGTEYDYYRWCGAGCGLYCYDREASKWLKLA